MHLMNKQENNSRAYLVMFFLHVSTESIFHKYIPHLLLLGTWPITKEEKKKPY